MCLDERSVVTLADFLDLKVEVPRWRWWKGVGCKLLKIELDDDL